MSITLRKRTRCLQLPQLPYRAHLVNANGVQRHCPAFSEDLKTVAPDRGVNEVRENALAVFSEDLDDGIVDEDPKVEFAIAQAQRCRVHAIEPRERSGG